MSMPRGKYHYVNGKLRRRYNKRRKVVETKGGVRISPAQMREVRSSIQQQVDTTSTAHDEVNDIIPIRLEAILNGLWSAMSLGEKVEAISTHYFDPSNPGND